LASFNEAKESHLFLERSMTPEEMPQIDNAFFKGLAIGKQRVSKFRQPQEVDIILTVVVIRLPSYKSEILISMNAPFPSGSSFSNAIPDDLSMVLKSFSIFNFDLFESSYSFSET
jgi:hypothetical protein